LYIQLDNKRLDIIKMQGVTVKTNTQLMYATIYTFCAMTWL